MKKLIESMVISVSDAIISNHFESDWGQEYLEWAQFWAEESVNAQSKIQDTEIINMYRIAENMLEDGNVGSAAMVTATLAEAYLIGFDYIKFFGRMSRSDLTNYVVPRSWYKSGQGEG